MNSDVLLAARKTVRKSLIEYRKIRSIIRKDKYDRIAADLQDLLLQEWDTTAKEAIREVIRAIKGPDPFTRDQLENMVRSLDQILGERFAGRVAGEMERIQSNTYGLGVQGVTGLAPTFNLVDQRALTALNNHNVYWVKNFYDQNLREKTVEFGEKIIREGLNRDEAGTLFEKEFAQKFEAYSWRYWNGYANHVVTRSRELGAVSGYEVAGIEWAEVRAIRDHRTTQVCRNMHGRRIKVSSMVEIRDKLIAAENPEDVKDIAPWPSADEIANSPSDKLPDGALLPPYHFNCRSQTVKWVEKAGALDISDIDISDDGKSTRGVSRRIENRLEYAVANQEQLSKAEVRKLVEFGSQSEWGTHKIRGMKTDTYHYKTHKDSPYIQATSKNNYTQKAFDLMNDADDIYLLRDDRGYHQVVFRKSKNNVIIKADEQRLQTFFTRGGFDSWIGRRRHLKLDNSRGITKWLKSFFKNAA